MIALLLAAALLADATPAAAPQPASNPQQAAPPGAAKPKPKSDLVCHDDTPTGSRLTHRTCVSRASQEAAERATDYAVDRMMKSPQVVDQGH